MKMKRGDIYTADLNPVIGSEQGGVRPVLIIQNDMGNRHSTTVIVAPITGRSKTDMVTHVVLSELPCLRKTSVVLLEQVRTVDKSRLKKYIGAVTEAQIVVINHAIAISLGLNQQMKEPVELSLCSICADHFYTSGKYQVKQEDKAQKDKRICTYCGVRYGFDFWVTRRC